MIRNFKYFIVFTSTPSVLPEQNDRYRIQPGKVNEIKAYKKAVFLEKTTKNPFVGRHGRFEGRGHLATIINIIFVIGVDILNVFYLTTFSKKTIFSKI